MPENGQAKRDREERHKLRNEIKAGGVNKEDEFRPSKRSKKQQSTGGKKRKRTEESEDRPSKRSKKQLSAGGQKRKPSEESEDRPAKRPRKDESPDLTSGLILRRKISKLSKKPDATYSNYTKYLPLFIHKACIPGLSPDATAFLLSLCHVSDWSAELISSTILKKFEVKLWPNQIWDVHRKWVRSRHKRTFGGDERFFQLCLREHGWNHEVFLDGKGLSQKPKPWGTTVQFSSLKVFHLSMEGADAIPLFQSSMRQGKYSQRASYTKSLRKTIIHRLIWSNIKTMPDPNPDEMILINGLGPDLGAMIIDLLSQFTLKLLKTLEKAYRWPNRMNNKHRVEQISKEISQEAEDTMATQCREKFGIFLGWKMDENGHGHLEIDMNIPLSPVSGACYLLYCMIADRSVAIITRRDNTAKEIAIAAVDLSSIPEAERICSICTDAYASGKEKKGDESGEQPVKLVFCCGSVFGDQCLKNWLDSQKRQGMRGSCPHCRTAVTNRIRRIVEMGGWKREMEEDEEAGLRDGRGEDSQLGDEGEEQRVWQQYNASAWGDDGVGWQAGVEAAGSEWGDFDMSITDGDDMSIRDEVEMI